MAAAKEKKPEVVVPEHIKIVFETGGPNVGRFRTFGMRDLGLPELEIRGVPLFFANPGAGILNRVAQYMYDGAHGLHNAKPMKLGHRITLSPYCVVQLEQLPPIAEDLGAEVWALTDTPMQHFCDKCQQGLHDTHSHGMDLGPPQGDIS